MTATEIISEQQLGGMEEEASYKETGKKSQGFIRGRNLDSF
jgi:hypothetical protein